MIDHWWQTETGWAIAANCIGIERLPVRPGSSAMAVPGYDLRVLDEQGDKLPRGRSAHSGEAAVAAWFAPTLWGSDHCVEAYLPHTTATT